MLNKISFNDGWKFKIAREFEKQYPGFDKWRAVTVPGTVHTDLLQHNLIPDPFYGENENTLQWIADVNWHYRKKFIIPEKIDRDKPVFLFCEGLDTVAKVILNEVEIARCDNMFRGYKLDISRNLIDGENILEIHFTSARQFGREMIKKHGDIFSARWAERSYVRKAQYSFGWDWGPVFPTMGIWRNIWLWQPDAVWIESVAFDTVELDSGHALVQARISLSGLSRGNYNLTVMLTHNGMIHKKEIGVKGAGMYAADLRIDDPALWWPNGSGPQNLYDLNVNILDERAATLDTKQLQVGIRTVELVEKNAGREAFFFKVNHRPIFMRGANWIPADSFIPRITREKYSYLLNSARNANMNMLRVWGGGIYENSDFYELCDRLGLMVWQDFMFACAAYPEHQEFLENVSQEIMETVSGLQHHPSIAIWCGNNENEWIWHRENMGGYTNMPGYTIFHKMIPELVAQLDPYRKYWPTSPFGKDQDPNDPASGNRHQWDIWSNWVDYDRVEDDVSLFVTEFGFQGPANAITLEKSLPEHTRNPLHRTFEFHNKQIEGNERIFRFLAGHLPVSTEWHKYIYLAQLNQGLALKRCLEHWRGRWPDTAGAIIWQLNDCWPVTSWALIDSDLLPKLAYYFVKQAFELLHVQADRKGNELEILIINDNASAFRGRLHIDMINLGQGKIDFSRRVNVSVDGHARIRLSQLINSFQFDRTGWCAVFSIMDQEKKIRSRNFYLPDRWKYNQLAKSDLILDPPKAKKDGMFTIQASQPAFFVDIDYADDRGFIMLPGESKSVKINPVGELQNINAMCLNDYLILEN